MYYLWCFAIFLSASYHGIGYFVLLIENDIQINLTKIKPKFIRDLVEGFIIFQRLSRNKDLKDGIKNGFLYPLYFTIFNIIIMGYLIYI